MRQVIGALVVTALMTHAGQAQTPHSGARSSGLEITSASSTALRWDCEAITSFKRSCQGIQDAVERSLQAWIPLNAFDNTSSSSLHPAAEGFVSITARNAGTAIVLDFNGRSIPGERLKDFLLAANSLLPNHITSLSVKHVNLTSPVEFKQTSFERALTLENIRFSPGADCETKDFILFDGVSFERPMVLDGVRGCGRVLAIGTKFKHGLLAHGGTRFSRMIVSKVKIDHELFIYDVEMDGLQIDQSIVDVIQARKTKSENIEIRDSSIFSLSLKDILISSSLNVVGNHFGDSVVMQLLEGGFGDQNEKIYIADNVVGGRFSAGFARSGDSDEIDASFHHNTVIGSADFLIHRDMPGTLEVHGSTFKSELLMSLACAPPPGPSPADKENWEANRCVQDCSISSTLIPEGERLLCAILPTANPISHDDRELLIDFTGSSAGSLIWNLPGAPTYKWKGAGLRYAYWDPKPRQGLRPYKSGGSEGDQSDNVFTTAAEERIRQWGTQLVQDSYERVDALAYLAEYQKTHGYLTESGENRRKALEANRAGYLAGLQHQLAWDVSVLGSAAVLGANWLFNWILWPVGYGAHPERALIWMIVLTFVFWLLYKYHSIRSEGDWPPAAAPVAVNVDDCRTSGGGTNWSISIPHEHIMRLLRSNSNGRDTPGLKEAPGSAGFLRTDATIAIGIHRNQIEGQQEDPPAYSKVAGFNQYNSTFPPRTFNLLLYSIDAMLPVVNLHHFDRYYPFQQRGWQYMRALSIAQHGLGWLLSTLFLASLILK